MDTKLIEYRCPQCSTAKGALLFKASGNAVIELRCWRCGQFVLFDINTEPDNYEEAKQMAKANT